MDIFFELKLEWLDSGLIELFVLAIINKVNCEVVETWKFNIDSTFKSQSNTNKSLNFGILIVLELYQSLKKKFMLKFKI